MRVAYVEAVRLAAGHRLRLEELERRHAGLNLRIAHEEIAQDACRRDVVGTALGPFCDCFGRLKNVYLAPVESVDLPRAQELPGVVCSSVRVPALGVLGSLVAGLTATAGRRVRIHWATLQLSPQLVDYVLAHELAHLREAQHGPAFWHLLARVMPDYDDRKPELATRGAGLWYEGSS